MQLFCEKGRTITLQLYVCHAVLLIYRFVESEVELNEVIQEMHVLATVPDYYSIMIDLNTIQTLLHLLNHDNTDIVY